MKAFVGIDVGASHIEAAMANDAGSPWARIRRPGIVVRPGHASKAAGEIGNIIESLTREQSVVCPIDAIVVGAAGTHTTHLRSELAGALKQAFSETLVHVTTDGAIALESAFGDRPGIVVCAGSGSIAYARDPENSLRRAGGLGPILADEGSGYAVGVAGLRAAARAADGRLPSTALAVSIMSAAGVTSLDELVDWAWNAARPTIAALARVVCDLASSGDEVSRAIVETAASDLGLLVQSLAHSFGGDSEIDVAFSGGILNQDSPVRPALRGYLEQRIPKIRIADRQVDPVLGAISMARRLAAR